MGADKILDRLTGKNINIAILDSGIAQDNILLNYDYIINGFKGSFSSFSDKKGHGTAIAYLIQNIAKESKIYNVKIFDDKLVTNTKRIIDSIEWCIENEINIINLSTAIIDFDNYKQVNDICTKAFKKGVIIVASGCNAGIPCLPAYLENVIGVGTAELNSVCDFMHDPEGQVNFYSKGNLLDAAWIDNKLREVEGTSYAAANITGIIALIMEESSAGNYGEIMRKLSEISLPFDEEKVLIKNMAYDYKRHTEKIILKNNIPGELKNIKEAVVLSDNIFEVYNLLQHMSCLQFELKGVVYLSPDNQLLGNIDDLYNNILSFNGTVKDIPVYENIETAVRDCKTLIVGSYDLESLELQINNSEIGKIEVYLFGDRHVNCKKRNLKLNKIKYSDSFLHEVMQIEPEHFFDKEAPVVALINLSSIPDIILDIELELRNLFKSKEQAVGIIGESIFSQLFGVDFYYDNSLLKGLSEEKKVILLKSILESTENLNEKNELIITSIYNGVAPASYSVNRSNMQQISNITTIMGIMPEVFLIVVDEATDLKNFENNIKVIGNIFDFECIGTIFYNSTGFLPNTVFKSIQVRSKERIERLKSIINTPVFEFFDKKQFAGIEQFLKKFLENK